jgi:hypothetical protein
VSLLLRDQVDFFAGATTVSATPATIELYATRLVLSHDDGVTGADGGIILDVPLAGLRVRGSATTLVFIAGRTRRRVDFSPEARIAARLGFLALVTANHLIERSHINEWVTTLRILGVPTRYMSYRRVILLASGITIALIVAALVAAEVASGNL